MISKSNLQWGLEDLLADLRHARRTEDMGRMALIAYCEVRRWAREAGESALAERSARLVTDSPKTSRAAFFGDVDGLIQELEQLYPEYLAQPASMAMLGGSPCEPDGALAA